MNYQELYREKLYSGPIFDLAKVRMRLPSGRERDYDLVEHGNSVTIVPVDASGQVYFVDQHRVGSNSMLLELPAGMLDAGEDPLEGARREIREEIGMDAEQIIPLGGFYLAAGYSDEYLFAYLAKGLFASPLDPDEDEFINLVTMPAEAALEKAFAGEFHDGKTLAALFLAMPYIKSNEK